MKTVSQDTRFVKITNCKICDIYKKIPKSFGGYLLQISWKKDDNDFFSEHQDIHIDQNKFLTELVELSNDNKKRLCLTNGMTDIDIYVQGEELVIYYSINDGSYVYFHFDKEEWKQLINKVKLEIKD
jgi:hypothetical protein